MAGDATALLERSAELEALRGVAAAAWAGPAGRLVVVAGEAGIGKTAVVRGLCRGADPARVLWGGCDALHTPRPLGPLLDVAAEAGGRLAAAADEDASPGALVAALADELRRRAPAVLVVEDLHWADDATLDAIRLLARRLDSLPSLIAVTCRDDELDRTHPARVMLGELAGRSGVERVRIHALSPQAVAALAVGEDVDVALLHARTGGNPFFVTEVLASRGTPVPETVRDAVLARAARLDPAARTVLDALAVVPTRAELWLLEALAGPSLEALERCLVSGMLTVEGPAVGFRHEIARAAIESALPLDRAVALHRAALAALTASERPDPARLAHHAELAGDADAVLEHAPAAGERAARVGSHSEAAAQFARALRFAGGLPPERRAALLDRRSYECYLTDRIPEATEARRAALEAHAAAGDRLRQGESHRWLSRLAWFAGDNATAEQEAVVAVELLSPLPVGRELAMAYSNMAQLRMLASDRAGASGWGRRAIELAERLGETEILAAALNTLGTAELRTGSDDGLAKLERSLDLAAAAGLEDHVARAHTNIASAAIEIRRYALAERHLETGIAYCGERDLDAYLQYMTGWRARAELEQGRWEAAAESAASVLRAPGVGAPTRITPLEVIGRLRARRGDGDAWGALDEALALARPIGELQRLGPVSCARAEARWLAGETGQVAAETDAALALALRRRDAWVAGELYAWRRRAGVHETPPDFVPEPFGLELGGAHEAAARAWAEIGCPYEAALALAGARDERALRRSLSELQRLGARTAARIVARRLRERGARDVRRGPRGATRRNPAGLTARQLEVLALVAEGCRNADIAARLFLSEKTVDHHVSAILLKLGARTRGEAASKAAALGITAR